MRRLTAEHILNLYGSLFAVKTEDVPKAQKALGDQSPADRAYHTMSLSFALVDAAVYGIRAAERIGEEIVHQVRRLADGVERLADAMTTSELASEPAPEPGLRPVIVSQPDPAVESEEPDEPTQEEALP